VCSNGRVIANVHAMLDNTTRAYESVAPKSGFDADAPSHADLCAII
jgi:hypothetical protein